MNKKIKQYVDEKISDLKRDIEDFVDEQCGHIEKEQPKGFYFREWMKEVAQNGRKHSQRQPKGFDFRDLERNDMPGILISLLENNFAYILKDDNHKTMNRHIGTMQAGIIIEQHFNRIRDGEINWEDETQNKYFYYYDTTDKKLKNVKFRYIQDHPSWFYLLDKEKSEVKRMKELYGFCLITYYLTGGEKYV